MNRAERRAQKFRGASPPISATTMAALTALGLDVEGDDVAWGDAADAKPLVDRFFEAAAAINESMNPFFSSFTSDCARELSGKLLACADAFDAAKAEIDRLKAAFPGQVKQAMDEAAASTAR